MKNLVINYSKCGGEPNGLSVESDFKPYLSMVILVYIEPVEVLP